MSAAPGVTLHDVFAARRRLRGHLLATPLRHSDWLSDVGGSPVSLKLESLQHTNSFKLRGALNAAMRLREADARAVVTASAGNHGRALALAAETLELRAVVFTPATAPQTKKAAIRRHGADLRDEAGDYDTAERLAREYAAETGAVYVSPYNHPDVIAGAGTIGLEILESAPDVETVVVPLGGGGLAAGVAIAIKAAAPQVKLVGVEVSASRPFSLGIESGGITEIEIGTSIADGLVGNLEPNAITFDFVRRLVDVIVCVGEDDIRRAIRGLAAEEHIIAEGAGATATAAVLLHDEAHTGRTVAIVSGGNIDLATLSAILAG